MRRLAPLLLCACGAGATVAPPGGAPTATAPSTTTPTGSPPTASATAVAPPRPGKLLTIPEARRYMLALVNRDRATQHLPPVELDEGAPTRAGQRHAEDMARLGFLGHWGSDGSVPEQRYTDAGGADITFENALCFTDQTARPLDPDPKIDPADLERSEAAFFNEVPPNDGHRKNILRPGHKRIGIGIAQPVATPTERPVPCIAQELIYVYGTWGKLPARAKVGDVVHVEGTMGAEASFGGVGVARVDAPKPIPVAELNTRRSYTQPEPFRVYWPEGFVTPIPVKVSGRSFSIDLPLDDRAKPGLYEISVFAKLPGAPAGDKGFTSVSLRTILVAPR